MIQGSVAVIAGASGGIGRAIAAELLSAGAETFLIGRSLDRLRSAFPSVGIGGVTLMAADLTDPEAVARIGSAIVERNRLDILVLSAGIYERSGETAVFNRQICANVLGPYALVQTLRPILVRSQGQVIFINSSQALRASADVGQYAATMHAMKAIADSLRDEVNALGVRVTSLYLGRTAGERQGKLFAYEGRPYTPDKLIQPADIAQAVRCVLEMPSTAEVTDLSIRPMRNA